MSNRHLARTIAMQSLFEWDFLGRPAKEPLNDLVVYNHLEFAPEFEDGGFITDLVEGVVKNVEEIDQQILTFAPHWKLENMTNVDRSILRLGVFELIYSDSVPSKVAIDEAIEMAKSFSGDASGRFINGVLGAMYKDRLAKGETKEVDKEKTEEEPKVEESKAEEAPAEETKTTEPKEEITEPAPSEAEEPVKEAKEEIPTESVEEESK